MNELQYIKEPLPELKLDNKNRFRVKHCPCGKNNKDGKFVPFVGYENEGYCHSCCETFLPKLPKLEQWQKPVSCSTPYKVKKQETPKPVSFIPFEVFKESLQAEKKVLQIIETNNFLKFLFNLFNTHNEGVQIIKALVEKYFIGTSKHWEGGTVFYQIDISGKIRTGKIMQYNSDAGKRIKEPYNHIHWVHSKLKLSGFNLLQCFFGEHLLQGNSKTVAIVESEKTATIASVYFPQFIWLSAGSKEGLNIDKCKVLKGRKIILFPDLNGFEKWSHKAKEFNQLFPRTQFNVSELLERNATETEKKQGLDLADYLIRFDYEDFNKQKIKSEIAHLSAQSIAGSSPGTLSKNSFLGHNGKFYIPTPANSNSYAVYDSAEAYNKRLQIPDYIDKAIAEIDFKKFLPIDFKTLTTIKII